MALFQNSVLKKYLKSQHTEELKEKWTLFRAYFHNSTIQENIRNSKEEQFQEGFLRELFVKVLGYTLNPEPNFNLTTEYKNVKDSKKADGAIIINGSVKAIIELKGTDTTDLGKVESQAFNYKNNQPECIYVVTSNFEKLRFYVENAIEHLEFNLFNLTEEEFHLLYVCLAHKNIENNVAKHIKDESVSQEDVITKKLYNDYSLFKRELYQNLVKLNPGYDPLELFKKSQKLLDRFLFIFFAEDRSLLPTNLIFRINKEWQQLREMRIEVSLYDRYKIYFNDLNHGAKVSLPAFSQTTSAKKEEYQIYAYNGGLFKDDEILNAIKIDDDILFKHTEKLSNYDFASEVDVNILGHIFENSLNELDEIKAQLEGQAIDKTKTKRKKDGVFYTPKYITKYIVDNTVGKLSTDKKAELQLNEADYTIDKKRQKKTTQDLSDKLNTYRNWLLQLTICDPACGSGAFLNQALDFLIAEHRYIDELQAKLFGDALVLSDVEGSILENNLFGVDINEESVEIAKLSLWLRTAQPNRKLNDLNSNIKCGNSLIDDVSVAGDKAFSWEQEFPQVFQSAIKDKHYIPVSERLLRKNPFNTKDELGNFKDDSYGIYNEFHEPKGNYSTPEKKHGFDVVIGNPPYLRLQGLKDAYLELTKYYENTFKSARGNFDIYALFMEKSLDLISIQGIVSFILPHKFLVADFGIGIRGFFKDTTSIESLIHFGSDLVFVDASTYTCIINLTKSKKDKILFKKISPKDLMLNFNWDFMYYKNLTSSNWDLQSEKVFDLITKLNKQPFKVEDVFDKIFQGIATSLDDVYVFQGIKEGGIIKGYNSKYEYHFEIEEGFVKPFVKGNQLSRNNTPIITNYVVFPYHLKAESASSMEEAFIKENYPNGYNYLKKFEKEIKGRENGKMNKEKDWYLYIYPKNLTKFHYPKIMTQEISLGCNMTYDTNGEYYHPTTIYSFVKNVKFEVDEKYYLGILNSKVMWFFLKNTGTELGGGYFRFKTNYINPFPLPNISENSQLIIDFVNLQLANNEEFQKNNNQVLKLFL
jgi:hypothetical protein